MPGFDLADHTVPLIPEGRWWLAANEAAYHQQVSRGLRNKARAIALLDALHVDATMVMEEGFSAWEVRDIDGRQVPGVSYLEMVDRQRFKDGGYTPEEMREIAASGTADGHRWKLARFIPYTDPQLAAWFPEGWRER